jgi:hypothetical protein
MALAILFIALLPAQLNPAENLRFQQPQVNLGELRSHVVHHHCFAFVNQGPESLEIDRVESSCGCLAAKLERRLYQPGEKGELDLEIKPSGQTTGPQSWFAKVEYHAGTGADTAYLHLQAVVRHEVSVTPTVLIWTGADSREVTVTDSRNPPLTVRDVHFSSPLVRAQVDSTEKGVTRIVLRAASAFPEGRRDEMLWIYTSDPVYSALQTHVTLIGQARANVTATPDQVSQRVTVGQPLPSTLIRVRPCDQRSVAIQSVSTDDPAITCTFAHGPFNEATLKIQVNAAKLGDRDLNGTVRVQLREPVAEVLTIPVRISR